MSCAACLSLRTCQTFESNTSSVPLAVIIGASVGGGILLIAAIVGLILWTRHKSKKAEIETQRAFAQAQAQRSQVSVAVAPQFVPGQFPVQAPAPYPIPYQPHLPMQQMPPPGYFGQIPQPYPAQPIPMQSARETNDGLPLGYQPCQPSYGPAALNGGVQPCSPQEPRPHHHHKSHRTGRHHRSAEERQQIQQEGDVPSYVDYNRTMPAPANDGDYTA